MGLSVLCAATPYLYIEAMTKMKGAGVREAVERTLKTAKVTGHLAYYKVTSASDTEAQLIVVAKEKTTLNDGESCVMKMKLENHPKKGWKATEYEFVDSFKRGKDAFTMPPYW